MQDVKKKESHFIGIKNSKFGSVGSVCLKTSNMIKKRTKNIWGEVIIKYLGDRCFYCYSKEKLHVHHRLPISRGGLNEMANLDVVCQNCHNKIHKQINILFPIKKKNPSECTICGQNKGGKYKKCRKCVIIPKMKHKYYKIDN